MLKNTTLNNKQHSAISATDVVTSQQSNSNSKLQLQCYSQAKAMVCRPALHCRVLFK